MFTTSQSRANPDSKDSRASGTGAAAYNSRNAYLRTPDSRIRNSYFPGVLMPALHRCVICTVLLTFLFAAPASAQNWTVAEEQLAAKIVSATGVKLLALEVANRSSLSAATADDIRRNLLTQLAVQGVRFVSTNQAEKNVLVSLSEDLQNYVWVAEIRQSSKTISVVMVSFPRPAALNVAPAAMELRKVSLWSQEERILDVAVTIGNPARMLVLDANGVTVYGLQNGRWHPDQLLQVAHTRPWPRDLRGRLSLRADKDKNLVFEVHLPGVFCKSSSGTPLTLACSESDDPWPVGSDLFSLRATYTSSRNFFSGAPSPGIGGQTTATAPPFYSAAAIAQGQTIWWLLAAVDGRVHLLDGVSDQVIDKLRWGSDVASLHSDCGSGWQVLATGDGKSQSDTVQAFEVAGREITAASPALDLKGSVTALWSEAGGAGVIAVVQNLQSGRYEAFRLTVSCGS